MSLAGRRVLITGGGGMIGANLVRHCLRNRAELFVTTRLPACPPRLRQVEAGLRLLQMDLQDPASVMAAVDRARPEIVVHLAATAFNPSPAALDHVNVNVRGTACLLEALAGFAGSRFVQAGSAAQYGDGDALREDLPERPANWLGMTKTAAAALVHGAGRLHGLHTVELRLFTPFGPWEAPHRLIPHAVLSALAGKPIIIRDRRPQRDFVYVGDVVDALAAAMTEDVPTGSVVNIASGVGRSVLEVVEEVRRLTGRSVEIQVPDGAVRPDEIWRSSADIDRAVRLLGWRPRTSFSEALQRTIDWFTNAPPYND